MPSFIEESKNGLLLLCILIALGVAFYGGYREGLSQGDRMEYLIGFHDGYESAFTACSKDK